MAHHAVDERHALAATLRRSDAEAGTLCGEWTVARLAAHLVLRERSALEMAGRAPGSPLRGRAEAQIDTVAATWDYARLVDAVDAGPSWRDVIGPVPVAWFWALPAVRERVDLLEYLIHHEDVRRAVPDTAPRSLPVAVQMAVWRTLRVLARLALRSLPVAVVLRWPSHGELRSGRIRPGAATVTVTGDPVELLLVCAGRQRVARVDYEGSPADVETVRTATLGL